MREDFLDVHAAQMHVPFAGSNAPACLSGTCFSCKSCTAGLTPQTSVELSWN